MPTQAQLAFGVTWLTYCSFYFTRKPFSVAKSTLGESAADGGLGMSTPELGLIDSSFLAAYAVSQFILGPMGDRIGARPMLITMLTASALSCAAFALCPSSSPALLSFLWAVNGISQSAGYPLCMKALVPHIAKGSKGTVMGWWCTCQQVGGVLSTAFASWLLGRLGWRASFLGPACTVLVMSAIVAVLLPHPPTSSLPGASNASNGAAAGRAAKSASATKGRNGKGGGLLQVAQIPFIMNLGGAYFFVKMVRYTLIMWLPYFLSQQLKFSVEHAGYMSTLYDLGGMVGAVSGGVIADKVLGGRRISASIPAVFVAALVAAVFNSISLLGVGAQAMAMASLGFLIAIPDTSLGAAATQDVCERHGAGNDVLTTALSITNGIGGLGPVLQGTLTPMVVGAIGWDGLFRTLAVVLLVAAVVLMPAAVDEWSGNTETEAQAAKKAT